MEVEHAVGAGAGAGGGGGGELIRIKRKRGDAALETLVVEQQR